MQTLLLGASGYLGTYLYDNLKLNDEFVIGTYSSHPHADYFKFDLLEDKIEKLDRYFTDEQKCAILCAGMTRIDSCLEHVERAKKINVDRMMDVLQKLYEHKYHLIFCSTDAVFDGKRGCYDETAKPCPINMYGAMKLEIESFLQKYCPDACIVRLSKIIGAPEKNGDVCAGWLEQAKNGTDIYCIKDNYLTFVDVLDAVECIKLLRNQRKCGIYHVCGNERLSRKAACEMFLRTVGVTGNIIEKELDFFKFKDKRPLDTSMCNQKICKELNVQFKSLEQTFERYKVW